MDLSGAPRAALSSDRRRTGVLVVHEDPEVERAARRIVGQRSWILVVRTVEEALGLLAHGARFDLILCDGHLPERVRKTFQRELARVAAGQAERLMYVSADAFADRGPVAEGRRGAAHPPSQAPPSSPSPGRPRSWTPPVAAPASAPASAPSPWVEVTAVVPRLPPLPEVSASRRRRPRGARSA